MLRRILRAMRRRIPFLDALAVKTARALAKRKKTAEAPIASERRLPPPNDLVKPKNASAPKLISPRGGTTLADLFDADWYRAVHGLGARADVVAHFHDVGASKSFAPHPRLAQEDKKTLTPWGAELLLRLGVRIGARPGRPIDVGEGLTATCVSPALRVPELKTKPLAVVTACLGRIDPLAPLFPEWLDDADFYAFVDHEFEDAEGWRLLHPNYHHEDARRRARFVKTHLPLYFQAYERVMWLDSNIFLCDRPSRVLKALDADHLDFATFRHPDRDGVIMEASACIYFDKEDPAAVFGQLRRMGEALYGGDAALFETNVLLMRPNVGAVRRMCGAWWREISNGSKRDQMSLPIVINERADLHWGVFREPSARKSRYFVLSPHGI